MLGNACAILAFDECAVVVLADVDPFGCSRVSKEFLSQLFSPCVVLLLLVDVMFIVALLPWSLVMLCVGAAFTPFNLWRPRLSFNTLFRKCVGWADSCRSKGAAVCVLRRVACAVVLVLTCVDEVTFVLENTIRKSLAPRSHRDRDVQQKKRTLSIAFK